MRALWLARIFHTPTALCVIERSCATRYARPDGMKKVGQRKSSANRRSVRKSLAMLHGTARTPPCTCGMVWDSSRGVQATGNHRRHCVACNNGHKARGRRSGRIRRLPQAVLLRSDKATGRRTPPLLSPSHLALRCPTRGQTSLNAERKLLMDIEIPTELLGMSISSPSPH
ncbi:hypothetical protein BD414DRAFT_89301 [Trametes punicea]|nr:hypothetical protein BD414DRAFT_89301 [Trametes punicea]